MAARSSTKASPVDGGDVLEGYSWSQVLADLTVTVPLAPRAQEAATVEDGDGPPARLCGADVDCLITATRLRVLLWSGTPGEKVVLDREFSNEIVTSASEYSLSDGTLIVDLEKRVEGFWECLFEGDRHIDIRELGPAVGEVGKVRDPNEPQKIEDAEEIARVVKNHPELAAGLAQRMMRDEGGDAGQYGNNGTAAASLVTQTATTSTYRGASSFEW